MSAARAAAAVLGFLALWSCSTAPRKPPQPDGGPQSAPAAAQWADPRSCAACHPVHARTHAQSGMGRAFARATPAALSREDFTRRNTYYHAPSERHYTMIRRGDRFFQRRHQKGLAGAEINVVEKEIHYVLGSGNHARTYLHRAPGNRLIQLPLGWYPEGGGAWAMNPGYDRPDHYDFRRETGFACMFCHNGYAPALAADGAGALDAAPVYPANLPEGIDCQRCHGPGEAHVAAAQQPGAEKARVAAAILNPAKLPRERRLEVCMQCHLETTSFPLPHAVPRFGRGVFSYSPAEPLAAYMIHFDHAPAAGRRDKFEIVNAVYRLRQSACFAKSGMTCTTCHNPHEPARASNAPCLQCHQARLPAGAPHTAKAGCVSCHMPKRRTEDVVHAVMTDHLIQRRAPANPLAPRPERNEDGPSAYRGEVALYYPPSLPPADRDLYTAVAQVAQRSNLNAGIAGLAAAIDTHKPAQPDFAAALADALVAAGRPTDAAAHYRRILERNPRHLAALRGLADAAAQSGSHEEALAFIRRVLAERPGETASLHAMARAHAALGRTAEARAALEQALAADPDLADAWNSLGALQAASGNMAEAERAWREAIRHQPDLSEARVNLGNTLAASGRFAEAALEAHAASRARPAYAPAWELLGNLAARNRQWRAAADHYRKALAAQPGFDRAQLGLGTALLVLGDPIGARTHLEAAASSTQPAVRQEAAELLHEMASPAR